MHEDQFTMKHYFHILILIVYMHNEYVLFLFQINKLMRAGANILAPITVNTKYPPGTIIDYAYNVFYQVGYEK